MTLSTSQQNATAEQPGETADIGPSIGDPAALPIFGPRPRRSGLHALAGTVEPSSPQPSTTSRLPFPPPSRSAARRATEAAVPARAMGSTRDRGQRYDGDLDWRLVAELRAQASDRLTASLGDQRGQDRDAEREQGRAIISKLLDETAEDRIHAGEPAWSPTHQRALAEALFDHLFGMGRVQPYLDDDTVENITINGAGSVWLDRSDGTRERVAPAADSDEELVDFISFIASRTTGRPFSPAAPTLHMRLDDGSRLAAVAWVTARPFVVIRRHRLIAITLGDLVERGSVTGVQASLLAAAVKGGLSIVVSGAQGAGKTTLVRGLCAEIPAREAIGTFEDVLELYLHDMEAHPLAAAFEARPGSGEFGPDGSRAGEYTIAQALTDSFRMNLSRQIVGEVRGAEVWPMIKAMESGSGSISTTHAADGEDTMSKLITCAMESGQSWDVAARKLARAVDLIVHVEMTDVQTGENTWQRTRRISEVLHVTPGEHEKHYATTEVFRRDPNGGAATAYILPDELAALERHGFNLTGYLQQGALASSRGSVI